MASNSSSDHCCRLCRTPLRDADSRRRLCAVCDDYAQHVALHTNQGLDRVVGDLQNGPLFLAASRNMH